MADDAADRRMQDSDEDDEQIVRRRRPSRVQDGNGDGDGSNKDQQTGNIGPPVGTSQQAQPSAQEADPNSSANARSSIDILGDVDFDDEEERLTVEEREAAKIERRRKRDKEELERLTRQLYEKEKKKKRKDDDFIRRHQFHHPRLENKEKEDKKATGTEKKIERGEPFVQGKKDKEFKADTDANDSNYSGGSTVDGKLELDNSDKKRKGKYLDDDPERVLSNDDGQVDAQYSGSDSESRAIKRRSKKHKEKEAEKEAEKEDNIASFRKGNKADIRESLVAPTLAMIRRPLPTREAPGTLDDLVPMPKLAQSVMVSESFLGVDEDLFEGHVTDFIDCSKTVKLKPDHVSRPVWVAPDGRIFLETFSPIYKQAYDFLVAIAEPVSRPELIQEYRLTPYALYAAVSVGLDADSIIAVLSRLCKTMLPPEVPELIHACTKSYGKAKLVLHKGKYYIQTDDEDVLRILLADRVIQEARIYPKPGETGFAMVSAPENIAIAGGKEAVYDASTLDAVLAAMEKEDDEDVAAGDRDQEDDDEDEDEEDEGSSGDSNDDDRDRKNVYNEDDDSDQGEDTGVKRRKGGKRLKKKSSTKKLKQMVSIEIHGEHVEYVKRRCIEIDYPLMEEYDFRNDTRNPSIDIDLKPIAKVRPYQEKSLAKMFGNGRARSGVIVLPCGAGKSLVGVTAATTVKKPCLCLCTSSVSVEQWRHQFSLWTTIPKDQIGRFTAGGKNNTLCPITVTTYSMISHSGKRAPETQKMLDELKSREWGIILLDEVHVVPANVFRRVLGVVKAHCKLGLTATLLREDHKIGDINFLIGPKLYEANWIDLQRAGYLATVQCAEVWCPMTAEFYREYLNSSAAKRKLLYAMNPNKFRMCEYLVRFHEARGDKVIIFSDNIFALRLYATKLKRPFIYGPTSQTERIRILYQFQNNPELGTILLSKVGDTSIDIPEANVLIQVSSHYGSRRQEAQRLGRILRPKPRAGQNFNAFFYSLVSSDTQEMYYSSKRQQFLVDQGYSFKVITQLEGMDSVPDLSFSTKEDQLELLQQVLMADEAEASEKIDDMDADELGANRWTMQRRAGGTGALSGAEGFSYAEYERNPSDGRYLSVDELLHRPVVRHSLFRKRFGGK